MPNISKANDYQLWLTSIKSKFQNTQIKAAVSVNKELLNFYWELGADIVEKQKETNWGSKFLQQLSTDLQKEFPTVKGFSKRNLELIRKWYLYYSMINSIAKQAVSQLKEKVTSIPWGHNIAIISKCNDLSEALFYVKSTTEHGWSRSVLIHQIESGLYNRESKALNNFSNTLPAANSDLAEQTLKDPYVFDFLTLTDDYKELELEKNLIDHITQFLLELGAGFAYIGHQVPLNVGGQDFYLDLLFYHTQLHCYVVIELKTTNFQPEFTGKLNFYIKAVDELMRKDNDAPTIGLLLCKSKNKTVVEYSLSDLRKPIGVSEYQLSKSLPKEFKSKLPSIKELENELSNY